MPDRLWRMSTEPCTVLLITLPTKENMTKNRIGNDRILNKNN